MKKISLYLNSKNCLMGLKSTYNNLLKYCSAKQRCGKYAKTLFF